MKYTSKDLIYEKAKALEKTKFRSYDIGHRLDNAHNKGAFGHLIEEGFFGYALNSNSEPDFIEADLELKVTPFVKNKSGKFVSKERLVLNMINYMRENLDSFQESSFWKKNHSLLIIFYLYLLDVNPGDLEIMHVILWEFPEKDLEVIKRDWKRIADKIRNGRAHELSEGDTLYLGACRKGHKNSKKVKQPFSSVLAHRRAYSLKQGYMTYVLNQEISKRDDQMERILPNYQILEEQSFEEYLSSLFIKYKGHKISDLCRVFNVNPSAKHKNQLVVSRILKLRGSITKTEEYIKGGFKLKTIRLNLNNQVVESMSFPHFSFHEIVQEKWEESGTRDLFYETRFMFVVFKETLDHDYAFEKLVFHSVDEDDIDSHIRETFLKTQTILMSGDIIKSIDDEGVVHNNFPKSSENPICHVRPHGRDRNDRLPLPVRDRKTGMHDLTKMCFWLNSGYIRDVITKGDGLV
ncbi:MAG: hypothetical protein K9K93_05190 [Acholeplasmataceae bacterium]|nr:hypothetical protein [Acholeplasmataceae bacterium]